MARQKFEDVFKNKLAEREIQPSTQSWERLEKKLDNTGKSRLLPIWWAGIAATVVGGFIIAGLVFNKAELPGEPAVVDITQEETVPNIQVTQPRVVVEEVVTSTPASEVVASVPGDTKPVVKNTPATPVANKETPFEIGNKEPAVIAEAGDNNQIESLNEEQLINKKLDAILAEVDEQVALGGEPTQAEVDALLLKATAQISREKDRRVTTCKIDAGSLLFEVEMELEQSFRDRVFDVLKEGYLKARTAVANRSYP